MLQPSRAMWCEARKGRGWCSVPLAAVVFWMTVAGGMRADEGVPSAAAPFLIKNVPHVRQKGDFRAEACAEMYLVALGSKLTQEDVFILSEVDPALGRGANGPELYRALTKIGFKVGQVWYKVRAGDEQQIEKVFTDMVNDLAHGIPSIVSMRTSPADSAGEQYRLVLGYDPESQQVFFSDPAERDGAYMRLGRATFLSLWPVKTPGAEWTLVRIRLEKAGKLLEPTPERKKFTRADYALHCLSLRKKLPTGLTVTVEDPFVVVGDETPDMVRARARQTVRWAVDRLKALYKFENDPDQIVEIWFFKDKESYRRLVWEVFSELPKESSGYYLTEHHAIVADSGAGSGVVVKEIVRLFLEANFPDCPVWLAEGLALLYEQCAAGSGPIMGIPNWRLGLLQRAIRGRTLVPLDGLLAMKRVGFRGEEEAVLAQAEARYLCYYLQQKGVLGRFYEELRKNRVADPQGNATLLRVLSEPDLATLQKRWEAFILETRVP
ncbi:MAG: C39 family peptidase [Kiritimatiellae bacterium]|nr:C39 family peptidase [Kiritimatiellia bacterium]